MSENKMIVIINDFSLNQIVKIVDKDFNILREDLYDTSELFEHMKGLICEYNIQEVILKGSKMYTQKYQRSLMSAFKRINIKIM